MSAYSNFMLSPLVVLKHTSVPVVSHPLSSIALPTLAHTGNSDDGLFSSHNCKSVYISLSPASYIIRLFSSLSLKFTTFLLVISIAFHPVYGNFHSTALTTIFIYLRVKLFYIVFFWVIWVFWLWFCFKCSCYCSISSYRAW